jgi:hypothetical protein
VKPQEVVPGQADAADGRLFAEANATYALFSIVNTQLAGSPCRFYAINGGNELGGMFLTPEQCEAAKKTASSLFRVGNLTGAA